MNTSTITLAPPDTASQTPGGPPSARGTPWTSASGAASTRPTIMTQPTTAGAPIMRPEREEHTAETAQAAAAPSPPSTAVMARPGVGVEVGLEVLLALGRPAEVGEHRLRRVVTGGAADPAPRVRPGAAEVEPRDRCPVARELGQRALVEQVRLEHRGVEDVAAGQEPLVLEILVRDRVPVEDVGAQIRCIPIEDVDDVDRK